MPGPVILAGSLAAVARNGFADALPCDVTIVCGGPRWRKQVQDAAMLAFLRSLDPLRVASVCTSALILGAAGLLDGRAAATRRRSFAGVARPLAFDGGRQKRPAHPLCRRHMIETTARPLFPHPRHRTRSFRSSTLTLV
jgi:putative intracellular protease/amidase